MLVRRLSCWCPKELKLRELTPSGRHFILVMLKSSMEIDTDKRQLCDECSLVISPHCRSVADGSELEPRDPLRL